MVRLHLAHGERQKWNIPKYYFLNYLFLFSERFHSIDTKMKGNPLSLEELILMTIYSWRSENVEIYQWEMWNVKRKICEYVCWRLPISNQKYKRQLMKTNLLRQGNYKGRWLWEDLLNVWHDSLPCSVEWLCPMPMETTFTASSSTI